MTTFVDHNGYLRSHGMRERSKYKKKRRQYWLRKYMVAHGCNHCGYNKDFRALCWDHIIPLHSKTAPRIGNLINSNLHVLFKNIRKCQILCQNCHYIKTYKERYEDG